MFSVFINQVYSKPIYFGLVSKQERHYMTYYVMSYYCDQDCRSCECNPGGAFNSSCDALSGQCFCRSNLIGVTCSTSQRDFYVPSIDANNFQPIQGSCQVVKRLHDSDWLFTGSDMAECQDGQAVELHPVNGTELYQEDISW